MSTAGTGLLAPALLALTVFPSLAGHAPAQRKRDSQELPAEDPYTSGDPELRRAAGYVAYAPFAWAEGDSTTDVERVLGMRVLWVETEHFKLGSTLPEYKVPGDRQEKRRLREQLERLAQPLPDVSPRTRTLDPWLRLHLFALRAEDVYATFEEQLALAPDAFDPARPYLGQPGKFLVLLFEKPSTMGRYSTHHMGSVQPAYWRHYFDRSGSFLFAASIDCLGSAKTDLALHCLMAHGLGSNFVEGYRNFHHSAPRWLAEGMGQWFSRRVDPRFGVAYDARDTAREDAWDWEPRVHGRVKHEYFPTWEEMLAWDGFEDFGPAGSLIAWSRVDFLLRAEPPRARPFLDRLKAPLVTDSTRTLAESLLDHQRAALEEAGGMSLEALDRAWCDFVLASYPKR